MSIFSLNKIPDYDFTMSPSRIRETEIFNYLKWFVRIRWLISLGIISAGALVSLDIFFGVLNGTILLVTGILLFLFNISFNQVIRKRYRKDPARDKTRFIFIQILTDFAAIVTLNLTVKSFGSVFILFFIFHLVLTSIFMPRRLAFYICLLACLFASLPLWLMYTGFIEYNPGLTVEQILFTEGDPVYLIIFNAVIIASLIGTWFLTSEMSVDLARREKYLIKHNQKLIEIEDEKKKLTMRATHELKAPFAAIKSYLFTMRDGYCGDLSDKAQDVVKKMIRRCDQLTDRISDIIRLSNLKTSVFSEEHYRDVDLAVLVNDAVEEGGKAGSVRGINVKGDIQASGTVIRAIEDQLMTMLTNLVQNAVNYSYDNGSVTVSLANEGHDLVLRVADQGIGISAEAKENIFKEYFRTNEAVAHNNTGTGLGLSIVKEIVSLHKGRLDLESTPGKGSVFIITLPRR